MLEKTSTLKTLDLAGCRIGKLGVMSLFNALKTNTSLDTLVIDVPMTMKVVLELVDMLANNSSLKTLVNIGRSPAVKNLRPLLDAQDANTTLTTLTLNCSESYQAGIDAYMERNRKVTSPGYMVKAARPV